jgi:hypothetical protein
LHTAPDLTAEVVSKLRVLPADALRMRLTLPPPHQPLLAEAARPSAFVAALQDRDLAMEAVTFLSYALPEREAVWWACMCVLHTEAATMAPEQHRALAFAQDWVRKPTEEKRLQGRAAAREAGDTTAAAFTARAVFASRLADPSSLSAGRRVQGAVRRAADADGSGRTRARLDRFIASALEIAAGGAGRLSPERNE